MPEFHIGCLPNRPIEACLEMGRRAEELNYAGIWVADSHSVMRDMYCVLSVLAVQTSSLQLASGVTLTGTRHPAVLANSWATLQELSKGRAICGIGVGESAVFNLGMRPEKLAVFEQKLKVIRALIRGDRIEYEGHELHMPWSKVDVPIVMASSGPKSLQMAGRLADGVLFQVGAEPGLVQYALDNIQIGAEASGRKLSDLKLYMRVACSVNENRKTAQELLKGYAAVAAGTVFKTLPRQYFSDKLYQDLTDFKAAYDYAEHGSNESEHSNLLTDRIFNAVSIAGPPDEAIQRFKALTEMGIDGFVMPLAMPNPIPVMEYFAQQVMPHV
jgi:5,10-methylenetetrahydromethanopterin reductase